MEGFASSNTSLVDSEWCLKIQEIKAKFCKI